MAMRRTAFAEALDAFSYLVSLDMAELARTMDSRLIDGLENGADDDLKPLHTAMLRSLIPLAPRPGEDLQAQLERLHELRAKQRELIRLEARLRREAQFNRKVALNRQVRALRQAVSALASD
jgi:hypothetical protein